MGATNTKYACLHTQVLIDSVLGNSKPMDKMLQTLGMTQALRSAENTEGFEVIPTRSAKARGTSTSNRKVTVFGRAKTCPSVVTTKPGICTAVTAETSDEIDEEVYVTQPNFVTLTFNRSVYRDLCEGTSDAIARRTVEAAGEVLKAENSYAIATALDDADTYFGGKDASPGSTDEKLVKLYNASAQPTPSNLFTVKEQYRRKGYGSIKPIVLGGTTLAKFRDDMIYYRGVNDAGFDFATVLGNLPISPFVDYELDTEAQADASDTASRLFSWIPGHIQKVTYLDYEGEEAVTDDDSITKTVLNVLGEDFDYSIYDDKCNSRVIVTIGRYSDIWVPASTWFTGSDCSAEQTLLSWKTDCADPDCDDIQLDHSAPA